MLCNSLIIICYSFFWFFHERCSFLTELYVTLIGSHKFNVNKFIFPQSWDSNMKKEGSVRQIHPLKSTQEDNWRNCRNHDGHSEMQKHKCYRYNILSGNYKLKPSSKKFLYWIFTWDEKSVLTVTLSGSLSNDSMMARVVFLLLKYWVYMS